ncbi:competence protein [Streptococcus pneumoniae]|nr:competence protein [Streptococcus pneumoniae]
MKKMMTFLKKAKVKAFTLVEMVSSLADYQRAFLALCT